MRGRSIGCIGLTTLTGFLLAACGGAGSDADTGADTGAADVSGTAASASSGGVVAVTARDFAFDAPDSIPSGWTTLRFTNNGAQTHFFVLDHLPDGRSLQDFIDAVGAPFDSAWSGLQAGTLDKADVPALLGRLVPPWFAQVDQRGGVGLVHPGGSAQATVHLDPGTYVIECYVKSPDNTFHTALGMARQLTVTSASNGEQEPTADLEITFGENGMEAPATVSPGSHTVAVHYTKAASGILANDVHVAKLEEGQSAESLAPWMDWMNVPGLRTPAPATFLGGVQEVPVPGTAYFTVDLQPGRYAWISENAENGMVKEFTVQGT